MGDSSELREGLRSNSPMSDHKPSTQQIFNSIKRAILVATQPRSLEYSNICTEAGSLVVDSLDQSDEIENIRPRLGYNSWTQTLDIHMMPTLIHDSPQAWIGSELTRMVKSQFLSDAEYESLIVTSGSTFHSFQGQYVGSRKQPDWYILPDTQDLPSIVVESGWTESRAKLRRDMRLWLVGGIGQVQIVLLFNWSKISGGLVKSDIEVWDLDSSGNERLIQTLTVLPDSPAVANQTISVTRSQIFGTALPPGRNPNDTFDLSIANLRNKAARCIQREGLDPA